MKKTEGAGRSIMIADKYFRLYLKDSLVPYELNAAEGVVLHMMYMKYSDTMNEKNTGSLFHGNTQDELIKEIHFDKGVMTRTMKSLEDKGFVERSQNPSDSRSFLFCFTEKGIKFRDVLMNIFVRWNSIITEGIDEKDIPVISAALEKMAANAALFYFENSQ
ncbi:MAG: MarR family transcriptional regulator [Treponema sp.]|uniref:MarR family winged helix-turn-helix transcriptional regulator n=1 Tax=Treponema sp. TaxID=166 RepID=UPI00298E2709|nr:MarR family transcriptional regulator [Treponema sp.]MCQ2601720.1 MarR family transcriptional regulator [Treponema sp.]